MTACLIRVLQLAPFLTMVAQTADAQQADIYHITAAEKAACTSDATSLCADAYPDERKLLTCMQKNHASLSQKCSVVFDAGLRRRHLTKR